MQIAVFTMLTTEMCRARFVTQIFTLDLLFVKNVDVVIQKHKLRFTNVYIV